MSNVLKEYLVSLGFTTDQTELRQFEAALDKLDGLVGDKTDSMAGSFVKFFVGANVAVAGIAASLLALVDHVAMADQDFRLFAMHNYLNQDAAKGFKVALDELGVSLGDIYRDPELYGRFTRLLHDQSEMVKGMPSDFEQTMQKARDLRFEFSRLHVEIADYGLPALAVSIFKGLGGDDFLERFKNFNDWLIKNLPQLVDEISTDLNPVMADLRDIGKEVWDIFKNLSSAFIQFTGEITGDESLKSGEVNFKNLAKATKDWLDALLNVVTELDHLVAIFTAHPELFKIVGGAIVGGKMGAAWGPMGVGVGAMLGASGGAAWSIYGKQFGGESAEHAEGEATESQKEYLRIHAKLLQMQSQSIASGASAPTQQAIIKAAEEAGVPASIALSVAYQESRFNQSAVSPKGAVGVMQLMPSTASTLGVNPNDELQNIQGGVRYLRQLHDKFGDWATAVRAYNEGPGNVMRGSLPKETESYVPEVMGRASALEDLRQRYDAGSKAAVQPMGYHTTADNSTVHVEVGGVHINQPGASKQEVQEAVQHGVLEAVGRQNAQNHFELAGSFA